MSGYLYLRSEPGLYTVGAYSPEGVWHSDSDHTDREAAAARVHYLNGGAGNEERLTELVDERIDEALTDLQDKGYLPV